MGRARQGTELQPDWTWLKTAMPRLVRLPVEAGLLAAEAAAGCFVGVCTRLVLPPKAVSWGPVAWHREALYPEEPHRAVVELVRHLLLLAEPRAVRGLPVAVPGSETGWRTSGQCCANPV